jgi:peptidylprolyl isomerase/FKBP-type peptidyl-prolyl cis-trans isomerase FkpA
LEGQKNNYEDSIRKARIYSKQNANKYRDAEEEEKRRNEANELRLDGTDHWAQSKKRKQSASLPGSGKKRISAAERRRFKKQKLGAEQHRREEIVAIPKVNTKGSKSLVKVRAKFVAADSQAPEFSSKDIIVGEGKEAVAGAHVTVAYKGCLLDGTVFDSSKRFGFDLGAGDVIKAWDKGVRGMCVGGKRKLVCPPSMAYGKKGSLPEIPPSATLKFVIKLLLVEDA